MIVINMVRIGQTDIVDVVNNKKQYFRFVSEITSEEAGAKTCHYPHRDLFAKAQNRSS